jgi:hypothetical protein
MIDVIVLNCDKYTLNEYSYTLMQCFITPCAFIVLILYNRVQSSCDFYDHSTLKLFFLET